MLPGMQLLKFTDSNMNIKKCQHKSKQGTYYHEYISIVLMKRPHYAIVRLSELRTSCKKEKRVKWRRWQQTCSSMKHQWDHEKL